MLLNRACYLSHKYLHCKIISATAARKKRYSRDHLRSLLIQRVFLLIPVTVEDPQQSKPHQKLSVLKHLQVSMISVIYSATVYSVMSQRRPVSSEKQASSLLHSKSSYIASFLSCPAVPTKINSFKFVQRSPSPFLIGPP